MPKRRLYRLFLVYTCQNTRLLEITCNGSYNRIRIYDKRESWIEKSVPRIAVLESRGQTVIPRDAFFYLTII